MSEQLRSNAVTLSWMVVKNWIDRVLPVDAKVWGVPRGGAIVAGLSGRTIVQPEDAEYIIDDIIDSGKTRDYWTSKYPNAKFVAVIDKQPPNREFQKSWVHFPWEEEPDIDAENSVVRLLQFLGEDPKREGLLETPKRVIKAWKEMLAGYDQKPTEILSKDFSGSGYDQMIVLKKIQFTSTCEHHMLPFVGEVTIGYIPTDRVVGLSKLARIVDCFALRLQIQEQLTEQIAKSIQDCLTPRGVGVVITAHHSCMSCRGVKKIGAEMVTCSLHGVFREEAVRAEFFSHTH